jgi:NNP family nitrate/nitrite transporter-like MFS transporter
MDDVMGTLTRALKSGDWPSLLGAWLHFEVSFMVWLLIGALGVFIAEEFNLTATQKGFLVAVPLLSGALLRVLVGASSDIFGPKSTGLVILVCEFFAVLWGWKGAASYGQILGVGLALGVAGASFAVALPLASRAYPLTHQGLAMGVAASANSGTVLAAFFAPRLAEIVGWHGVFGIMAIPILLAIILFGELVRGKRQGGGEDDRHGLARMITMLRQPSVYWLCFIYAVTFGGFVGFSSFLPIFFHDEYGMGLVTAGSLTALCGLAGSLTRPVGGYAADRAGGLKVLLVVFPAMSALTAVVAQHPQAGLAVGLMVTAVAAMGFGNGVVFQVVSDRFQKQIGMASGLIGAAGGIGGFLLPVWLGWLRDVTGTYQTGFLLFAAVSVAAGWSAFAVLRRVQRSLNTLAERGGSDGF